MVFNDGWRFEAQMHYALVQGAVRGIWRVKTHGYRYQLALLGVHRGEFTGTRQSPAATTSLDLHLNLGPPGSVPEDTMEAFTTTGRMTLEDAVTWAFNAEIAPARDDWQDVLDSSRAEHIKYRSWSTNPPLS